MDIAEIGFKADTTELDKASSSLNKFKIVAGGIPAASKAVERASLTLAAAKTAEARATLASLQAAKNASRADVEAAKQALRAAQAEEQKTRAHLASAKAIAAVTAASQQHTAVQQNFVAASGFGGAGGRRGGGAMRGLSAAGTGRDQMVNRFNTANVAAQFQDIGVTAAMGMNPLTIAIQQGTQLSAILTSMENPLKGIGVAFRSIINPVSLISIGLVALVAAGIQMVDWARVAQNILLGLASLLDILAGSITVLGQGLLIVGVAFATAATAVGIYTATQVAATLATTAGRAAALAQAKTLGLLVVQYAVLGAKAVSAAAKMAAGWVIAGGPIVWITTGIVAIIAALGTLALAIDATLGTGLMKGLKQVINWMIGSFIGAFKGIGAAAEALWNKILRKDGPTDIGKAFADAFKESLSTDYLESAGQIIETGLGKAADKLRQMSVGIGVDDKDGKKSASKKNPWEELTKGHDRRMADLKAERDSIGLSALEVARLKYETDLLNEAQQKGIELNAEQKTHISEMAEGFARMTVEVQRLKDIVEFSRETTKGFFRDLRQGIKEGESLWDSFKNAALNALNKIQDKMFEAALDNFLGGGSGGGGGFLSGLGSLFGGGLPTGLPVRAVSGPATGSFVIPTFAKGGVFTNSIVDGPTPFMFASGGAFGVMGESGPEAVVPLQRGSDGSLGVVMHDMPANSNEPVINNYNTFNVGEFATQKDLMRVQASVMAVAGPGKVEERVQNAQSRGSL